MSKSVSSPTTTLVTPVVVFNLDPGNWKDLFETFNYKNIKIYDFSTLYTSFPHTQLKSRPKNIVHGCYSKKDGTPW